MVLAEFLEHSRFLEIILDYVNIFYFLNCIFHLCTISEAIILS